jgi:alcohol dehydrogenase class IV
MLMEFGITGPREVMIGGGAVRRLPHLMARFGFTRPLIVTDPTMVATGLIERCLGPLREAGLAFEVFSDTVPEPTDDVVEAGVAHIRAGAFDCLIGFGGGSPIDTAKAMTILAAGSGKMRDYKVPAAADRALLPLIAIPTTAGTGSEMTRFTVITDRERDEKMLIAGLGALPLAALVDFELTLTRPPRQTADTGIDALTHALEAYVSRRATPYSDALALAALRLIGPHLERAYRNPEDHAAREAMMLGASLAGLAFSNSSVALVHGLSRPIGAHFHVPHGLSNAMLLPTVTRFSLSAALPRYAAAARALGFAAADEDDERAGERLVEALERLNRDLAVPSPRAFGIDAAAWEEKLPLMAEQALASGSPANNPRVPETAEILTLYRAAYDPRPNTPAA